LSPSAAARFRSTVEIDGDFVRVRLFGELDMAGAAALQRALDAALSQPGREIIVELRGLRFLDVTGMRAMLAAGTDAERRGCRLQLSPGPAAVMRVFELTGTIARPDWTHEPVPASGRFTRGRVRVPGGGRLFARSRLRD
jgi:anti-sigma B factor antagonist